jgi:hypothetical protein
VDLIILEIENLILSDVLVVGTHMGVNHRENRHGGDLNEATTPDTCIAGDGCWCAGIGIGLPEPL